MHNMKRCGKKKRPSFFEEKEDACASLRFVESLCSPVASADEHEEGSHSPLIDNWPGTTARHIYTQLYSPRAPMGCMTSLQQPHSDSYEDRRETLKNTPAWAGGNSPHMFYVGETEKHSLLPTFHCDDVDSTVGVSVRLEAEFIDAVGDPGCGRKKHNTPHATPDSLVHLSLLNSRCMRGGHKRNEPCRIDTTETTHVFVDPTPELLSPHTPLNNIIPCSASHTPHVTQVPLTPQKSARPPPARLLTPSAHKHHASTLSLGRASQGPTCGTLRSGSHVDFLVPNRNPFSPYRDFAATWGLTPPLKVMDTSGKNTAAAFCGDGGSAGVQCSGAPSIVASDGMEYCTPQRAEARIVMFAQTVPISAVTSPHVCSPTYSPFRKKYQDTTGSTLHDTSRDVENISAVLAEVEVSFQTCNTNEEEVVQEGIESHGGRTSTLHIVPNISVAQPSGILSERERHVLGSNEASLQAGVVECDLPLHISSEDGPPLDVSPRRIRSTCSFKGFDFSSVLGRKSPGAARGILNFASGWSSGSELRGTKTVLHMSGDPERTSAFVTDTHPADTQGDHSVNCFNSLNGEQQQQQQQEQLCHTHSSRSIGINDTWRATHPNHEDESGDPEYNSVVSDMDNEEFETVDRFQQHHRYQFLHWVPWRKMYSFVPLHMDRNGVVWLATHAVDGLPYAVKEVPFSYRDSFPIELECLTLGNAPVAPLQQQAADYILRYFTVSPYRIVAGESNEYVALLLQLEYFPMGNVMEWALDPNEIQRGVPYSVPPESFWSCVLQHGLLALEVLHAARIIHGNPLPFNLFMHSQSHFKLGNFGGAVKLPNKYPAGTPDVFLPSIIERNDKFTPYCIDIFVLAKGILQLLTQCILKRKEYTKRTDVHHVSDGLNGGCDCFTTITETLSEVSFQEYRASGFHDISDNTWYVLRAALHGTSIQDLLKMLHAPSRLLWGAISLFETEELRLRQRRHHILKELQKRKENKQHHRNTWSYLQDGYVDSHDNPISLISFRNERHTLPCAVENHMNSPGPQEEHTVFPLPSFIRFSHIQPSLASRHISTGSTVNSSGGLLPWTGNLSGSPFQSENERNTLLTHPQSSTPTIGRHTPLPSLVHDDPYQSHFHSTLSLSHCSNDVRGEKQSARRLFDGDGDSASITGSMGIDSVSHTRGRDEMPTSDSQKKVLDGSLEWTLRQVMAVMGWGSAPGVKSSNAKGMASSGVLSYAASLLPIRPLTSWE